MSDSPVAAHRSSPVELQERIEAERGGRPFLVYRDADGRQRLFDLEAAEQRATVGRRESSDIALAWDSEVSRLHAEIERIGEDWTVSDDGLSHNGSYVNGTRLTGKHRLRDGDVLRFGGTTVFYCAPGERNTATAGATAEVPDRAALSPTQVRVLIALCRPFKESSTYATPATNKEIAAELFLSVDAVKTHIRTLCHKFGVEELPQNQKRAQLVWRSLQAGVITPKDLWR